jgi:glycosyltransferase involved in cell wall biosynthesis
VTSHRVLHFLWSGHIGGAERAVYQIVREEIRLGEWEVGVAFGQAKGPWVSSLEALGCPLIDLAMHSTADLARALRRTNELAYYDIHHFHVLELGQLIASSRCPDATRVFTQRHGRHETGEPLRKRLRRSAAGVLLRKYVHAISGNTEHATRYAVERYRLMGIPSHVTYNGLDFSLLVPHRTREDVRGELGVGSSDVVVGSSGNFKAWKRFDRLVELLPKIPGLHVALVGDGAQRSTLERRACSLNARDRLHVTGLVSTVADYLQAMDLFALPSTADESFGNSVVEAMALGLPSIVFADSPALREHIENGVTGFVARDQAELEQLVERLAADPVLREQVGTAGSRYVRSNYTLENMHSSYRRLYEAAVASRGRS